MAATLCLAAMTLIGTAATARAESLMPLLIAKTNFPGQATWSRRSDCIAGYWLWRNGKRVFVCRYRGA